MDATASSANIPEDKHSDFQEFAENMKAERDPETGFKQIQALPCRLATRPSQTRARH
jgi:hypothetical protein